MEGNSIRNYLLDNKGLEDYTIGKTKVIIKRWLPKDGGEIFLKREKRPTGVFILSLNGNDGSNTHSQRERLRDFERDLLNYDMGAEPKGALKSILELGEYSERPKGQRSVLSTLARGLEFDEKKEIEFVEIYDSRGKPIGRFKGNMIGAGENSELYKRLKEDIQFEEKEKGTYVFFEFKDFKKSLREGLEDLKVK